MQPYGLETEPGTVRLERMLPASAERVWAYLTESDKRGTWLATGEMELRVGGKVEHLFDHATLSPTPETVPEKYAEYCGETEILGTITAIEPGRLLAYTWDEGENPDSEVTFELTSEGDVTRLVITHRKLHDREQRTGVAAGWHVHIGIMIEVLEGNTPAPFWQTFMPMEAEYEKRLKA